MEENPKQLTISTKRSKDFRVIPAEGSIGGITPSQMYQMNFYIESPNIPEQITHELLENGKLGKQIGGVVKDGDILRELQCAITMTIPQAESLARWILSTIQQQTEANENNSVVM